VILKYSFHRAIALIFLVTILLGIHIEQVSAQDRPNILFVIADDMGTDAFAPYNIGADQPNTPTLNRLAEEGLLFTNAWAYATCAPSRAALLTGRYGNKNGVVRSGLSLPNEEVVLFEHLSTLTGDSYADAVFGKWHLGDTQSPNANGIDHYDGSINFGVDDYFNWERTLNGVTSMHDKYVTTHITDEAIQWIDGQTKPWLVWMSHNAPHSPIHLPPDTLYTRTDISTNFDQYMCMIESVDHETDRLLNSLSPEERENTLIIFVGDNGTPDRRLQGYPAGHGKGSLYEGGIRVPMIFSGFGVDRVNEQESALVSFTDIFATITELLGTDLPGGIHNSFSFRHLLSGTDGPRRIHNYSEIGTAPTERAIRTEQYKLIINADQTEELYDLIADPFEMTELIAQGLTADLGIVRSDLRTEADSIFLYLVVPV